MIELLFHRELYAGPSVDEAVKVFTPYATFELEEQPEHWRVSITAKDDARERRIAGELGNYALGLTIKAGGASAPKSRDTAGDTNTTGQKASA